MDNTQPTPLGPIIFLFWGRRHFWTLTSDLIQILKILLSFSTCLPPTWSFQGLTKVGKGSQNISNRSCKKKLAWHSMHSSCMYTKCPWRIWMPIRLKNFSLPQTCTKGAFWKAVQYNHIYVPHLGNCPKMIVSVNSSNISQCSSKNQISPSSATQINATAKGTLSPLQIPGWIRKQG